MPKIERFEDLKCWQYSRELVKYVFDVCSKPPLSKDYGTQDQLRRASISILNNIAEGFARFNKKDFIHFLDFSQSSASEVISLSYCLEDVKYLTTEQALTLRTKAQETRNLTLALIKYINKTIEL